MVHVSYPSFMYPTSFSKLLVLTPQNNYISHTKELTRLTVVVMSTSFHSLLWKKGQQ